MLSLVATGATVFIVSESYLGRPISAPGGAQARDAATSGRILVCSLLMALVVGLGFLLLVIPGVILVVGLALAIPAVVLEPRHERQRRAVALLGADPRVALADLRALGSTLLVLLYIPVVAITGLFALLLPAAPRGVRPRPRSRPSSALAIGGLVQMFIYPLFYCVLTVTYYDLRVRKEGFDLELLASTLQTA